MKYQRIGAYPSSEEFEFPELRALSSVWKERRGELEGNGALP